MAILTKNSIYGVLEKDHKATFRGINQFYEMLGRLRLDGRERERRNLAKLGGLVTHFRKDVVAHMKEEERTLFPFLRAHIPRLEPMIYLLQTEHDDFRHCLGGLVDLLTKCRRSGCTDSRYDTLKERGTYLVCLLRSHMWCESHSLYKAADSELREDERKEVLKLICRVRRAAAVKQNRNRSAGNWKTMRS